MTKANIYMKETIEKIMTEGYLDKNPRPKYKDGTPAYTVSVNHNVRAYDLSKDEFPILTLRPIAWKTAIKEILWIYKDQTSDLNILRDKYNIKYWDEWESKDAPNTIGMRYGATVKRYNLIENLINDIKTDPYGRRKVMSLWQENDLKETDGLAPCAFLTIWNVRNDDDNNEYLDMCLIQRSGDMIAASGAGCINEVQYAALLMMIAQVTGYNPGVFTHFIANEQIYSRHEEATKELMNRYFVAMDKIEFNTPKLTLNPNKTNFYDFTIDDFKMENYEPMYPQIKFELGI